MHHSKVSSCRDVQVLSQKGEVFFIQGKNTNNFLKRPSVTWFFLQNASKRQTKRNQVKDKRLFLQSSGANPLSRGIPAPLGAYSRALFYRHPTP